VCSDRVVRVDLHVYAMRSVTQTATRIDGGAQNSVAASLNGDETLVSVTGISISVIRAVDHGHLDTVSRWP